MNASLADSASCAQALVEYGGRFLATEEIEDNSPFDLWVQGVRLQASQRLGQCYEALIQHRLGEARLEDALALATAWVDSDPLNDMAHLELMKILVQEGRPQQAIHHFESFRETKVAGLGQRPRHELQVLYAALRQQTVAPAPSPPPQAPSPPGPERVTVSILGIFPDTARERPSDEELEIHLQRYLPAVRELASIMQCRWQLASDGILEMIFGLDHAVEGPQIALHAAAAVRERVTGANHPRFAIAHGRALLSEDDVLAGTIFQELRAAAREEASVGAVSFTAAARLLLREPTQSLAEAPNMELAHPEKKLQVVEFLRKTLASGSGSALWITGPAGIGKSWLVAQALSELQGMPVLRYQCREIYSHLPLKPLAVTLRALLRLDDHHPQLSKRILRRQLALLTMQDPLLLELWMQWLELEPDGAQNRDFLLDFLHLLEESALELVQLLVPGPRIIVVEDAHWADASSLALLSRFSQKLGEAPVALLVTCREPEPSFASGVNSNVLRLQPISDLRTSELLDNFLPSATTAAVRERLIRLAGGIPLYVDSIARLLASNTVQSLEEESAIIDAYIGSVDHLAKTVLQGASIFGTPFSIDDLATVLGEIPEAQLEKSLHHLVQKGLMENDEVGLWKFRHELLRESAKALLTGERLQGLHATWAEYLTQQGQAQPAIIAEHWLAATRYLEAGKHYATASRTALEIGAYQESRALAEKGLSCPDLPLSLQHDLLADRYFALRALYGYSAELVWSAAESLSRSVEQVACRDRVLLGLHFGQWIADSSKQNIRAAIDSARLILDASYDEIPQPASQSLGYYALGWTEFWRGNRRTARQYLKKSLELWSDDWSALLQFATAERPYEASLGYLGLIAIMDGDIPAGLRLFTRAEGRLSPERHRNMWLFIKVMRATMGLWTGNSADTLHRCPEIFAESRGHGFILWHVFTQAIAAWAEGREQRVSAATALRRIQRYTQQVESVWSFGASILYLAQADLAVRRQLPQSSTLLFHARRHCRHYGAQALLPQLDILRNLAQEGRY